MRRGVVVLIAVVLLSCGQGDSRVARAQNAEAAAPTGDRRAPEEVPPAFVVSSDPAEPIIRVTAQPTLVAGIPGIVYTLFGNGRLERAETSTQTYVARGGSPRSVLLDAQELHSLSALAAAPLLIEGDAGKLAAEFEKAEAHITDGSVVEVEILLASYSRGSVNLAPVERSFRMVEPVLAAKLGLGGKGVQALAAVVNGLFRLHADKEKAQ